MQLEPIMKKAIKTALSEGVNDAEVFAVRSRTLSVYVDDNAIKNVEEKTDQGLSVRCHPGEEDRAGLVDLLERARFGELRRAGGEAGRRVPTGPGVQELSRVGRKGRRSRRSMTGPFPGWTPTPSPISPSRS